MTSTRVSPLKPREPQISNTEIGGFSRKPSLAPPYVLCTFLSYRSHCHGYFAVSSSAPTLAGGGPGFEQRSNRSAIEWCGGVGAAIAAAIIAATSARETSGGLVFSSVSSCPISSVDAFPCIDQTARLDYRIRREEAPINASALSFQKRWSAPWGRGLAVLCPCCCIVPPCPLTPPMLFRLAGARASPDSARH